jgi:hypothetical protein
VTLFETLVDPGDSDAVRAVATAFAGIERDLHEAVAEHYETLGIEPPEEPPPIDTRVEQLHRLVSHHVSGDLWTYFLTEQAPEKLKNADSARTFAGMGDEEWLASLERLAAAAPDDHDGTTRELAGTVVERRFGLDLETFESQIVEWSPERTLRRALRGRVDADIERLRLATRAIEHSKE